MTLLLTALQRSMPTPAAALPAAAPTAGARPFGEFLRPAGTQPIAPPAASPPAVTAPAAAHPLAGQLLQRVARGERQVEALLRQAVSGRSFTPQELDLLGKLVDKGTNTVRTVLQQSG